MTMVRMRAKPCGRIGKPMPVVQKPSSNRAREWSIAALAALAITGDDADLVEAGAEAFLIQSHLRYLV